MNNIHQVIFNKNTQQYVVVSELAKSARKPKAISADSVDIASILQNFAEKRPLVDCSLSTSGQIHKATKDNKAANLLAHATLSALEAAVTGNNALAGAAAGVTGEGLAMVLAEKVFNKPSSELTADERDVITQASTLAGSLVAGTVGNSTASAVKGAETAQRAVENNFLSQSEYAELERLNKKKTLTPEEAIRVQYLLEKDKVSDRLLSQWQKEPDKLSQQGRETLFKWVGEYGNVPTQIGLLNTPINSPQMKPDYSDLKLRAQRVYNYSGSVQGRLSESVAAGIFTIGTGGIGSSVNTALSSIPKIGTLASKYPIVTEKVSNAALSVGATYASNAYTGRDTTLSDLAWSGGTGFITGGMPVYKVIDINSASSSLQAVQNGEDPLYAAGASAIATSSGAAIGKGIEKAGYRLSVGDITRNKSYYEPQYRTKQAMELLNSDYKYLPTKFATFGEGISSETINIWLKYGENDIKNNFQEINKGGKNEK